MLAIGCDHGGFALKNAIMAYLDEKGIEYRDFGSYNPDRCDYPEIAVAVAHGVADGIFERGILVCGTGIGMSLAANKVDGIRAAVCSDHFSCRYTRLHNDANILCLGGRVIGEGTACELVDIFLETEFMGGRHAERIALLEKIEKGEM